jgi:hypothetical protein
MHEHDGPLEDEDGQDYEREKAKSGKRTLYIVLGAVSGGLLLVVLGCAGLVYWGFESISNSPMIHEADGFLNDLKEGQVDAAHARTTKAFQERLPLAQFQAFLKSYPALTAQTSRSYKVANFIQGLSGKVGVTVFGEGPPVEITLMLAEENGDLKIDDLSLP